MEPGNLHGGRASVGLEAHNRFGYPGGKLHEPSAIGEIFEIEANDRRCFVMPKIFKAINLACQEFISNTHQLIQANALAGGKHARIIKDTTTLRYERDRTLFHVAWVEDKEGKDNPCLQVNGPKAVRADNMNAELAGDCLYLFFQSFLPIIELGKASDSMIA